MKKNRALDSLKYYLSKEKRAISILLGISMISSGIAVVQPLLMQKFIDNALILKDIDSFYYFVLLIVFVSILGVALSVFLQYNYTKLSIKVLYSLRLDVFEKIFFNNKLFFQKNRVGDLLSRLEGDISELQRFGIDSLFALFSALLGLIGAVVIMLFYDLSLAIFALILFPLEFFLLKPMYSKMHNITKDVRQSSSIMGSFIIESLRYVSFLKKFNAVKDRKEVLISLQKENKNKILLQQKLQIVFTQIPLLISLTARVVLIFLGGLKVINGEITIGQLISFLSYFSMVLAPVHTVLGILNNIPKLKVSINRLDEILPQNRSLAIIDKLPKSIDIEFKNVNFSYNNSYDIFRNLNLKIAFKDKIVLTGPNGIGKTTLIELLLNEHLLNKGEILLNGINIEEIKNETLQNHIALVEQNPVILSTTVKENLLIANKNADEDELLNVLEKVGLLFWFKSLERGFQTVLSEDGQNLSGGQKQRLAIARVILKKPSIVIMDEPTSSLDKDFIKVMDGLIDENFKESTKIIISHHFCYKNAKYLKIKDKKIVELKDE